MGSGTLHVKSRSYCSMESESFWYTLRWPTLTLLPTPPSACVGSKTQAEGVGCLDTAGGQGSDRDQTGSSITGRAAGSLPPHNRRRDNILFCLLWFPTKMTPLQCFDLQLLKNCLGRMFHMIHATLSKWYWLLEGLDHVELFQLRLVFELKGVNPQHRNPALICTD